jgi:hypothetical protein
MAELKRTISAAKQEPQPNTFAYMEVNSTTKYLSSYIHYYRVSSLQLGLPALSPLAPPPSYVYIYTTLSVPAATVVKRTHAISSARYSCRSFQPSMVKVKIFSQHYLHLLDKGHKTCEYLFFDVTFPGYLTISRPQQYFIVFMY